MDRGVRARAGSDIQKRRFARACSALCCIGMAICAVLGAAERASGDGGTASAASRSVFQAVMEGASLETAMTDVGFTVDASAVPSWFAREVLDVTAFDEWYATEGFEAVFVSAASGQAIGRDINDLLEERGWRVVTDDGEGVISLRKDEGMCRWMTASARETATGWEAVLHIQPISSETDGARRIGNGS